MDWLLAAINLGDDSDEEIKDGKSISEADGDKRQKAKEESDIASDTCKIPGPRVLETTVTTSDRTHKVINQIKEAKSDSRPSEEASKCKPIFSIDNRIRKTESFSLEKATTIDVPTCEEVENSEEVDQENCLDRNDDVTKEADADIFDCSYGVPNLNIVTDTSNFKVLKRRDWDVPDSAVIDINATDLQISKEEKDKMYSCTREALLEGRERYKMPERVLETHDGKILSANIVRRTQKRKHQIGWLAMEAQDKELELLERTAHMRKTKHETQMKYGW